MVRSVDEQKVRIAALEEQLQPRSWSEALFSSALHPKYSERVRLLSKLVLALLAGGVTLATCGLGFFLVRRVHVHYKRYNDRTYDLIRQIAKEKLYPAVEEKPEVTQFRRAKTPVDLHRFLVPSPAVQLAEKKIAQGPDPVPIPDELKKRWRGELQGLSFDNMPYLGKKRELLEEFNALPWTSQLEDREKTALDNLFFPISIEQDIYRLGSRFRDRNLEDTLDFLEVSYRIAALAKQVYSMLPDRIDLSSVASFFWIDKVHKPETVIPTIYGTALIAAYYEMKYGIEIQMGTAKTLKKLLEEKPSGSPYGFILFEDSKTLKPHVTPMIVFPAKHELLYLDSLGQDPLLFLSINLKGFKQRNLPETRQADRNSCRSDALSILSNALWHIRQMGIQSMTKIPEIRQNKLPPAWAKTAQISTALKKIDTTAFVRTKKEQTLAQLIEAHSEEKDQKKIRRYLLHKGYKYGAMLVELVYNKAAYPEIWALFHKKFKLFENDGFGLNRLS